MLDFHELIRPNDFETFKREYWEQQPLFVFRERRDYYDDLLTLADVDDILSMSSAHSALIRVVRDGQVIPLGRLAGNGLYGQVGVTERLYGEFRNGATIVLISLHERWKPLKQFCQSLAELFSAAFQVNAYLTPPHSRGLKAHYDTHDVFVLQLSGSKRWRIYDSPAVLPLPGEIPKGNAGEAQKPSKEFDLRPGEMIYLPRGWRHEASTGDLVSLHLTVGVYPVTWAAVLLHAVETAIEGDARFRQSLPIGFADDGDLSAAKVRLAELLDALQDNLDPTELIDHAAKATLLGRQPTLDGHLLDLAAAENVDPQWRLRKRPGLSWRLSVADDHAHLTFNGKVVSLPARLEQEIRFITAADEFTAHSLPGVLDGESRMVLVRRLLEEGFLTICRRS